MNRTGTTVPEHKRLPRDETMTNGDILELTALELALPRSHLYLLVPNALLRQGLEVMERWGFIYKHDHHRLVQGSQRRWA